VNKEMSVGM